MTNINNLEPHNTVPKPFVFVLIPFDPSFDDIYKFGIKGATEDVGAYAERVDEQIFLEGILDRRGDRVKSLFLTQLIGGRLLCGFSGTKLKVKSRIKI
jgi:hypothetical protein